MPGKIDPGTFGVYYYCEIRQTQKNQPVVPNLVRMMVAMARFEFEHMQNTNTWQTPHSF